MKYEIFYDDETRTVSVELPTGQRGTAKCCPTDAFSLDVGFALACERAKHSKAGNQSSKIFQKPKEYIPEIGDRVRFKSWAQMTTEYGVDRDGDIPVGNTFFTRIMQHLCGTYATVTELYRYRDYIELDNFSCAGNTDWTFSAEMVEKVGRAK